MTYVLPFHIYLRTRYSRSELGGVTVMLCTRSSFVASSEIGIDVHEIGRACWKDMYKRWSLRLFLVRSTQGDGDAGDSLRFLWRHLFLQSWVGNTLQRGIEITLTRILLKRERDFKIGSSNCVKCKFSPVTSFH
jgi:hypothetical protein